MEVDLDLGRIGSEMKELLDGLKNQAQISQTEFFSGQRKPTKMKNLEKGKNQPQPNNSKNKDKNYYATKVEAGNLLINISYR